MPELWRVAWPFLVLCLLASSRWLLEAARPEVASSYASEAGGAVLGAAFYWLRSSFRGKTKGIRGNADWLRSGVGATLLTGTALAALVPRRVVHADAATLALSLTPVVVAVAASAFGAAEGDLAARLWPGLAGVTGLLLLLPAPSLTDPRYVVSLGCMPLLSGVTAAYLAPGLAPLDNAEVGRLASDWRPISLMLAAAVFGLLAMQARHEVWSHRIDAGLLGAIVLDGTASVLTLAVLTRLGSMRWSIQFLVVPWFTLLEGILLLRPVLDWRSWVALGLLGVSSGYGLLFVQ